MNEEKISIPTVGELMRQAWGLMIRNIKTLSTLEVISWIPLIILTGFLGGSTSRYGIIGFAVIAILIRGVVSVGEIGVFAADNTMSVRSGLKHGWSRLPSVLVNAMLMSLISAPLIIAFVGIAAYGFTLWLGVNFALPQDSVGVAWQIFLYCLGAFIILLPGTIFIVIRLAFATTLAAIGGMPNVFRESWRMTHRRFWAVTWRLVAASVFIGIISSIVRAIEQIVLPGSGGVAVAIVFLVIQFVLVLYSVAYTVALIRALR